MAWYAPKLQRDSSTLKLIRDSTTGKLIRFNPAAFADSACSCFNGDAWDSETAYVIGDTVHHGGVYYNCIADNTNQEPPNASYWYDLSPFGGASGTPKYYTVTFSGITICQSCPDVNGTYKFIQDPESEDPCHWAYYSRLPPISGTVFGYLQLQYRDDASDLLVQLARVGVTDPKCVGGAFFVAYLEDKGCLCAGTTNNDLTSCGLGGDQYKGYGGTATWCPGWRGENGCS
ncbi:MAG: hypothetical protein ACYTEQ_05560 [Planctomycetota bacterium]|jgi:hypothetical protein